MLDEVVTGGQTGADQAALRAARAAGIPTGGWAPLGWLVETADGKRTEAAPWLAEYGLTECPEPGFPARARANVRDSDGTLWFGGGPFGVAQDPLRLLLRAGYADRLVPPPGLGRAPGQRHDVLRAGNPRG
jgi:hypothetical protein